MIIQIHGSLFACKVGEERTNRYTIITTERRSFHALAGTSCFTKREAFASKPPIWRLFVAKRRLIGIRDGLRQN